MGNNPLDTGFGWVDEGAVAVYLARRASERLNALSIPSPAPTSAPSILSEVEVEYNAAPMSQPIAAQIAEEPQEVDTEVAVMEKDDEFFADSSSSEDSDYEREFDLTQDIQAQVQDNSNQEEALSIISSTYLSAQAEPETPDSFSEKSNSDDEYVRRVKEETALLQEQGTANSLIPTPSAAEVFEANKNKRVVASDKRMINSRTDVNQLVPFKYNWAWAKYLTACENNWVPSEIRFDDGASSRLTPDMKAALSKNIGYFAAIDETFLGSVSNAMYRHITAPEGRQYLLRQSFENTVHYMAYEHLCESFDLTVAEARGSYLALPDSVKREQNIDPLMDRVRNSEFTPSTLEGSAEFLKAVTAYFCVNQGLSMHADMIQMVEIGDSQKIPGLSSVFSNIMRDRGFHSEFGVEVVNTIKAENPQIWTEALRQELLSIIRNGVESEKISISSMDGLEQYGLNKEILSKQVEFIGNNFARQVCGSDLYVGAQSQIKWASEKIRAIKPAGSSHARVSETLSWD